jgi:hypothetical protein
MLEGGRALASELTEAGGRPFTLGSTGRGHSAPNPRGPCAAIASSSYGVMVSAP